MPSAIAAKLRERSGGMLDVAEGTSYPVLHKLEKDGLIRSRWEVVNGRVGRRASPGIWGKGHHPGPRSQLPRPLARSDYLRSDSRLRIARGHHPAQP